MQTGLSYELQCYLSNLSNIQCYTKQCNSKPITRLLKGFLPSVETLLVFVMISVLGWWAYQIVVLWRSIAAICLRALSGLFSSNLTDQSSCRILITHAKTRSILHDDWSISLGENRPYQSSQTLMFSKCSLKLFTIPSCSVSLVLNFFISRKTNLLFIFPCLLTFWKCN